MKKLLSRRAEVDVLHRLGRRDFLAVLATGGGAAEVVWLLPACSAGASEAPPPKQTRVVRGTVTDARGNPQAIGRVYLLLASRENQNFYADVDAVGAFDFGTVDVGSYHFRYWRGSQAMVPEPNPNPVHVQVTANAGAVTHFVIALGNPDADYVEIYAGDNFYPLQPFGDLNGTVSVKLGTTICWYNVGGHQHAVTGGPWGDSGIIDEAGEFMWTANQVGDFGYRCTFHNPQTQVILRVVG